MSVTVSGDELGLLQRRSTGLKQRIRELLGGAMSSLTVAYVKSFLRRQASSFSVISCFLEILMLIIFNGGI